MSLSQKDSLRRLSGKEKALGVAVSKEGHDDMGGGMKSHIIIDFFEKMCNWKLISFAYSLDKIHLIY